MKEVFTFLLYREILTEDNKVVRRIPAVPKPYSSYSFSDDFIFATRDGITDVYRKHIPSSQLERVKIVPALQLDTFNQVELFHEKFFLVRIGQKWGSYDLKSVEVVPVYKYSRHEVEEILKKKLR